MRRLVAVVAATAVLAGACGGGDDPAALGRVIPLDGVVEVLRGGDWEAVTEAAPLAAGDEIRSGSEGWARIELGGGELELAPETRVRMGRSSPALLAGSILAEGRSMALALQSSTVRATGPAIFRVDRGISSRVGVYSGSVGIAEASGSLPLAAFWEAVVVSGAVPSPPRPLRLGADDPWDRRLLGEAIDAGLTLHRLELGLRRQLHGRDAVAGLIADALGGEVPPKRIQALLGSYAARARVFLALALAVQAGSELGVLNLTHRILQVLDLGGTWTLVVAQLGVPSSTLLQSLDRIIGSVSELFAPPDAGGGSGTAAGTTGDAGPTPGRSPSPGGGSGGGGSGGGGGGSGGGGGGGEPECAPDDQTCQVGDSVSDLVDSIEATTGRSFDL